MIKAFRLVCLTMWLIVTSMSTQAIAQKYAIKALSMVSKKADYKTIESDDSFDGELKTLESRLASGQKFPKPGDIIILVLNQNKKEISYVGFEHTCRA